MKGLQEISNDNNHY